MTIEAKHLKLASVILAPILASLCSKVAIDIDVDIHAPRDRVTPARMQTLAGYEPNTYGVNNPLPEELLE